MTASRYSTSRTPPTAGSSSARNFVPVQGCAEFCCWSDCGRLTAGFSGRVRTRSFCAGLSGRGRRFALVLVAGASRAYEAFQVAPGTPDAYWTVVDGDFMPVALADDYLRELRLGRRRAVSTTKAYAENLALFFDWLDRTGRSADEAPRELGRFV